MRIYLVFHALVLFTSLNVLTSQAYQQCPQNSGQVVCNQTQYEGRCGTLTQARSENWCTNDGVDVCCGASISDCCQDGGVVAAMTTVVLLTFASICCCSLLCCHARGRIGFGRAGNNNTAQNFPSAQQMRTTNMRVVEVEDPAKIEREKEVLAEYTEDKMLREAAFDGKLKECVVCFEQTRNVLLPCGHALLCQKCADDILASRTRQCPNCRTPFHVYKSVIGSLPSFRELSSLNLPEPSEGHDTTAATAATTVATHTSDTASVNASSLTGGGHAGANHAIVILHSPFPAPSSNHNASSNTSIGVQSVISNVSPSPPNADPSSV